MRKIILFLLLVSFFSYGFRSHLRNFFTEVNTSKNTVQPLHNKQEKTNAFFFLTFSENFENAQNWQFVNGTATNKWHIGTAAFTGTGSTKGLYISNDEGTTNAYTNNNSSTVHAYKVMAVPAGTSDVAINFDWRCMAESGTWDYMRVWITTDTFTPTAGTIISAVANQRIQVGGNFNTNGNWSNFSGIVNIAAFAGQNAKLIIEWKNDGTLGDNPPAAIDNITIAPVTCSAPQNITSSGITLTSANLSWDSPGTSNIQGYSYYYSTTNAVSPTTPPSGTVTGTTLNLESLTASTTYYFWVRTNCTGTDGNSIWTGPHVFVTLPANDECTTATVTPVNPNMTCTQTVPGTLAGASLSDSVIPGCMGAVPVKDVWYEFTATSTTHALSITGATTSYNIYMSVFNNSICTTSQEPLFCFQGTDISLSGLTVGNTYKVRVYTTSATNNSNFTFCVKTPVAFAVNDLCANSTLAPVNTGNECTNTVPGTFQDATVGIEAIGGCSSSPAVKDVWYHFTATSTTHSISLTSYTQTYNTYIALYPNTVCTTATTPIACVASPEMLAGGLTVGTTYKIRIYTTSLTNNNTFNVCIKGLSSPVPVNDNCSTSTQAPVNPDYECVETVPGTLSGATVASSSGGSCSAFATAQKDVWYHFTATGTSHGVSVSGLTSAFNVYIEVYESGVCQNGSGFLGCGSADAGLQVDNLIPGQTYKVRVYTTSLTNNSAFTLCVFTTKPPIAVNDTEHTIEELVTDVLVGSPCLVSNITWKTGTFYNSVNGIGYFSKNGSEFPFEEGVVLATGNVLDTPGPANGPFNSGTSAWLDDPQLTTYMNNYLNQPTQKYYNATILEFDFMPVVSDFTFNFIFASNEYGLYQCSFSDAFAFFLTDTTTGVTTNLALVPDTTAPISVVTIRKALHSPLDWLTDEPQCGDVNPEYFAACYDPTYNGLPPIMSPINFNGLTIPMIAESTVVPGRTYHIKLVIQDRGDSGVDSAVFLDGGSFNIGNVDFGDDLLVENNNALCDGESIVLDSGLNPDLFDFQWYKDGVLIEGATGPSYEATESGDYTLEASIPGSSCSLGDTVKVEIYPKMDLVKAPNVEVCVFGEEMPPVDITVNEDSITSNIPDMTDVVITYHETEQQAADGTNAIPQPTAFEPNAVPQTVYVRVHNTKTGCTELTFFDVVRKKVTNFTTPTAITTCVYHNVITPVDLTEVEAALNEQATAGLQITYYENEQDAINLTSEITNTTAYTPDTLPATIYINIFDEANQCRSILNFTIVESQRIEPFALEDITSCNAYVLVALPPGYYYSTEEFGKGEILPAGKRYNTGKYTVYTNINNQDGCVFSSKQEIEVIPCTVPKGISPNGDGLNDALDLTYYHLLEVKIFNRQGKEVYSHGPGYTNQWAGQSKNGNLLPDGTYFYKIITVTEELTGYVQLVREMK